MNELHPQLDRASSYDAEYGHNLATHLPMALAALQRLGASAEQREAFAARHPFSLGGGVSRGATAWATPPRGPLTAACSANGSSMKANTPCWRRCCPG